MEEFQYSDCEDSIDEVTSFTGECNYKSQPVDHDVQLTCVTQAAKHLKHPSIISRDNRLLELIQLMGKQIQVPPSDVSRYYALLYELARDYCKAFKHQSSDQGRDKRLGQLTQIMETKVQDLPCEYQSSRFLMAKNSSDVEFVKSAEELNECLKKRPPLTLNVRAIIVEKLTSFIYEYERLHRRQSSQNSYSRVRESEVSILQLDEWEDHIYFDLKKAARGNKKSENYKRVWFASVKYLDVYHKLKHEEKMNITLNPVKDLSNFKVLDVAKSYYCNLCTIGFKYESDKRSHDVKHTGERPYPCNTLGCGKTFKHSGSLTKHQRQHGL